MWTKGVLIYLVIFLLADNINVYASKGLQNSGFHPKAYIYSLKTISQTYNYCGWPTSLKSKDNELFLVYSGGREGHICPFGRIELMRSIDNGQTWNQPQIVVDTILDDRDVSICQSNAGTYFISWFTSTGWISMLEKAEKSIFDKSGVENKGKEDTAQLRSKDEWSSEKIERWQKMRQVIASQQYQYENIKMQVKPSWNSGKTNILNQWMIRSEDNGKTWSEPYLVPLMSPHGPTITSQGRLLLAGKEETEGFIGLCESTDDGKTWILVSKIPPMQGHDSSLYYELHIVEATDGTLIVHIRNHNKTYHYETLQTESKNGGQTWSEPHSIGVWGFPSHLQLLKNNTLLMTYSFRGSQKEHPESNRLESRLSRDNGKTWSAPMVLMDNLYSWDFGYPTTVELDTNKLLTIWYEVQPDSPNAVLRQAIWEIKQP